MSAFENVEANEKYNFWPQFRELLDHLLFNALTSLTSPQTLAVSEAQVWSRSILL